MDDAMRELFGTMTGVSEGHKARVKELEAENSSLREARDTAEMKALELQSALNFEQQKLAAVDAERIALQQEVEELRATIGTLDAL